MRCARYSTGTPARCANGNARGGASSGRRATKRWLACIARACRSEASRGAWAWRATRCAAGCVPAKRQCTAALPDAARSTGISDTGTALGRGVPQQRPTLARVARPRVRRRVRHRPAVGHPPPRPRCRRRSQMPAAVVPSSRRAARLLTTPAKGLTRADRQFVDTLNALVPTIRTAAGAVNEFHRILRERATAAFETWLTATQTTALRSFVVGILGDIGAVRAALSQPWSNGPVEGQVNRLKMLKRTMYGRAKFDLLRSRVLHAA